MQLGMLRGAGKARATLRLVRFIETHRGRSERAGREGSRGAPDVQALEPVGYMSALARRPRTSKTLAETRGTKVSRAISTRRHGRVKFT